MSRRYISRFTPWRTAVVALGSLALIGALAVPAAAAEPAGSGLDITWAHTSGGILAWSGTYSCIGNLVDTITVNATDSEGHSGTGTIVLTCLTPAAGQAVTGSVGTGLLGLGGVWGDEVTLTASVDGPLGEQEGTDTMTLVDNGLNEVSLDSVGNSAAGLTVGGGFECAHAAVPETVAVVMADPATGAVLDTAAVPVTCPSDSHDPGVWTATFTPAVANLVAAHRLRARSVDAGYPVSTYRFTVSIDGEDVPLSTVSSLDQAVTQNVA